MDTNTDTNTNTATDKGNGTKIQTIICGPAIHHPTTKKGRFEPLIWKNDITLKDVQERIQSIVDNFNLDDFAKLPLKEQCEIHRKIDEFLNEKIESYIRDNINRNVCCVDGFCYVTKKENTEAYSEICPDGEFTDSLFVEFTSADEKGMGADCEEIFFD